MCRCCASLKKAWRWIFLPCGWRFPRANPCRGKSSTSFASVLASKFWMASARARCCTYFCPRRRAKRARAAAAAKSPDTKRAFWTTLASPPGPTKPGERGGGLGGRGGPRGGGGRRGPWGGGGGRGGGGRGVSEIPPQEQGA